MSYTAIAGLARADIAVRNASLWIDGHHQLDRSAGDELAQCTAVKRSGIR